MSDKRFFALYLL